MRTVLEVQQNMMKSGQRRNDNGMRMSLVSLLFLFGIEMSVATSTVTTTASITGIHANSALQTRKEKLSILQEIKFIQGLVNDKKSIYNIRTLQQNGNNNDNNNDRNNDNNDNNNDRNNDNNNDKNNNNNNNNDNNNNKNTTGNSNTNITSNSNTNSNNNNTTTTNKCPSEAMNSIYHCNDDANNDTNEVKCDPVTCIWQMSPYYNTSSNVTTTSKGPIYCSVINLNQFQQQINTNTLPDNLEPCLLYQLHLESLTSSTTITTNSTNTNSSSLTEIDFNNIIINYFLQSSNANIVIDIDVLQTITTQHLFNTVQVLLQNDKQFLYNISSVILSGPVSTYTDWITINNTIVQSFSLSGTIQLDTLTSTNGTSTTTGSTTPPRSSVIQNMVAESFTNQESINKYVSLLQVSSDPPLRRTATIYQGPTTNIISDKSSGSGSGTNTDGNSFSPDFDREIANATNNANAAAEKEKDNNNNKADEDNEPLIQWGNWTDPIMIAILAGGTVVICSICIVFMLICRQSSRTARKKARQLKKKNKNNKNHTNDLVTPRTMYDDDNDDIIDDDVEQPKSIKSTSKNGSIKKSNNNKESSSSLSSSKKNGIVDDSLDDGDDDYDSEENDSMVVVARKSNKQTNNGTNTITMKQPVAPITTNPNSSSPSSTTTTGTGSNKDINNSLNSPASVLSESGKRNTRAYRREQQRQVQQQQQLQSVQQNGDCLFGTVTCTGIETTSVLNEGSTSVGGSPTSAGTSIGSSPKTTGSSPKTTGSSSTVKQGTVAASATALPVNKSARKGKDLTSWLRSSSAASSSSKGKNAATGSAGPVAVTAAVANATINTKSKSDTTPTVTPVKTEATTKGSATKSPSPAVEETTSSIQSQSPKITDVTSSKSPDATTTTEPIGSLGHAVWAVQKSKSATKVATSSPPKAVAPVATTAAADTTAVAADTLIVSSPVVVAVAATKNNTVNESVQTVQVDFIMSGTGGSVLYDIEENSNSGISDNIGTGSRSSSKLRHHEDDDDDDIYDDDIDDMKEDIDDLRSEISSVYSYLESNTLQSMIHDAEYSVNDAYNAQIPGYDEQSTDDDDDDNNDHDVLKRNDGTWSVMDGEASLLSNTKEQRQERRRQEQLLLQQQQKNWLAQKKEYAAASNVDKQYDIPTARDNKNKGSSTTPINNDEDCRIYPSPAVFDSERKRSKGSITSGANKDPILMNNILDDDFSDTGTDFGSKNDNDTISSYGNDTVENQERIVNMKKNVTAVGNEIDRIHKDINNDDHNSLLDGKNGKNDGELPAGKNDIVVTDEIYDDESLVSGLALPTVHDFNGYDKTDGEETIDTKPDDCAQDDDDNNTDNNNRENEINGIASKSMPVASFASHRMSPAASKVEVHHVTSDMHTVPNSHRANLENAAFPVSSGKIVQGYINDTFKIVGIDRITSRANQESDVNGNGSSSEDKRRVTSTSSPTESLTGSSDDENAKDAERIETNQVDQESNVIQDDIKMDVPTSTDVKSSSQYSSNDSSDSDTMSSLGSGDDEEVEDEPLEVIRATVAESRIHAVPSKKLYGTRGGAARNSFGSRSLRSVTETSQPSLSPEEDEEFSNSHSNTKDKDGDEYSLDASEDEAMKKYELVRRYLQSTPTTRNRFGVLNNNSYRHRISTNDSFTSPTPTTNSSPNDAYGTCNNLANNNDSIDMGEASESDIQSVDDDQRSFFSRRSYMDNSPMMNTKYTHNPTPKDDFRFGPLQRGGATFTEEERKHLGLIPTHNMNMNIHNTADWNDTETDDDDIDDGMKIDGIILPSAYNSNHNIEPTYHPPFVSMLLDTTSRYNKMHNSGGETTDDDDLSSTAGSELGMKRATYPINSMASF